MIDDSFSGLGAVDLAAAPTSSPVAQPDPFAGLGAVDTSAPSAPPAVQTAPADPFAGLGAVDTSSPPQPPTTPSPPKPSEYKPNEATASEGVATPGSLFLSDEDVNRIQQHSGADADYIRHASPWFGLVPKSQSDFSDFLRATAGAAVPEVGIDLYKKLAVDDPAKRKALDDLQAEYHNRRSYVRAAGAQLPALAGLESAGGVVGEAIGDLGQAADVAPKAIASAQRITQAALTVSGMGAQGAIEASEGHETAGAVTGSLLAIGLPIALHVGGAALGAGARAVRGAATSALEEFVAPQSAVDEAARSFGAAQSEEAAVSEAVQTFNPNVKPDIHYFARSIPRDMQVKMAAVGGVRDVIPEASDAIADAAEREAVELVETDEDAPTPPIDSVTKEAYNTYLQTRAQLGRILGVKKQSDWTGAFQRAGSEYVSDRVAALRLGTHLRDAIEAQSGAKQLGEVGWIRGAWMKLADAQFVYDAIDRRYGTESGPLLARGSRLYNWFQTAASTEARAFQSVAKEWGAAESTTSDGRTFAEAADSALRAGEFSPDVFTEKQLSALRATRDYYAAARERVTGVASLIPQAEVSPISVPELTVGPEKSYVPQQAVGWADALVRTRAKLEAYGLPVDQLFEDTRIGGGATPEATELMKGLEYHFGSEVQSVEDARAAVDCVINPLLRTASGTRSSASALFQRDGSIPDYLLERDHLRLAQGWATSMYRHVFLRGFVSDLNQLSDQLQDVSPVMSEYVRNHVQDLVGIRRGTGLMATPLATTAHDLFNRLKLNATAAANATDNPVAKWSYNLAARLEDVMRAKTANIYSYYLGLNPASAARYSAQTATNVLPQMSPLHALDAGSRVAKAYMTTAAQLLGRDGSPALEELRAAGLLPFSQMFESYQAAQAAMHSSLLGRMSQAASSASQKMAMSLVRSADVIGRYSTLKVAESVVADAAQGSEAALAHLGNVPAGFLSSIRRSLRDGDVSTATNQYADYLIGTGQANYNRVAMSEFGRSAGWLFTMFNKWPAMAVGELGGLIDARAIKRPLSGDVGRVLWKYLAPGILASQVQPWWKEHYEDAPTPLRMMVGRDMTKWFPSEGAVNLLTKGDVMTKSIPLEMAQSSVAALTAGRPLAVGANIASLALSATPLGAYIRFATNTLPGWLGEDPLIPLTPREIQQSLRGD